MLASTREDNMNLDTGLAAIQGLLDRIDGTTEGDKKRIADARRQIRSLREQHARTIVCVEVTNGIAHERVVQGEAEVHVLDWDGLLAIDDDFELLREIGHWFLVVRDWPEEVRSEIQRQLREEEAKVLPPQ